MKTLSNTMYYLLIAGMASIGLLVLATMVPIPGNISVKVVKSGSMEPAIMTGSAVVIKPAAAYTVGDVITFGKDTKTQIPTTHRIITMAGAGTLATYTVKGDANDAPDPAVVKFNDVRGKVLFSIPYLGYLLAFAKTKLGFLLLVGVPGLVVCIEETLKIVAEVRRMRAKKKSGSGGGPGDGSGSLRESEMQPAQDSRGLSNGPARFVRRPMDGVMPPQVINEMRRPSMSGMRRVQPASHAPYGVALLALVAVSATVLANVSGDTVAYYRSTQSSVGNVLQAAASFAAAETPAAPLRLSSQSLVGELPDGNLSDPETPTDNASSAPEGGTPPPADPPQDVVAPDAPVVDSPTVNDPPPQEETPPVEPPPAPPVEEVAPPPPEPPPAPPPAEPPPAPPADSAPSSE